MLIEEHVIVWMHKQTLLSIYMCVCVCINILQEVITQNELTFVEAF